MVAESKITEQFIYISTTMKIFFLKPSQDKATVLNCLETAPSPSQHKHLVKCNVLNRLTQDLQLIHELAHRVLQIHYRWRMFIDSLMIFYGFFGFVIFLPNFFSKGCSRGGGGPGPAGGVTGYSGVFWACSRCDRHPSCTAFVAVPAENVRKQRKQRNIWKGSPVFPDGIFQTEIRVPILQSHIWYQFQAFAVVFGKQNVFVQMVNAMPGRNWPVLNFAYLDLPKPWTDWCGKHGKQLTNQICKVIHRSENVVERYHQRAPTCPMPLCDPLVPVSCLAQVILLHEW